MLAETSKYSQTVKVQLKFNLKYVINVFKLHTKQKSMILLFKKKK